MNRLELHVASDEWDREVARLGGHPWQSALWGNALQHADGVVDYRWLVRSGNRVIQMIRFEVRRLPALGNIAWITRGPVTQNTASTELDADLRECLKDHGFVLAVANPWRRLSDDSGQTAQEVNGGRTIWIDLTIGQDRVWRNLSQAWRRGVRLARRKGVIVEMTRDDALISEHHELCKLIGHMKGFDIRSSPEQIRFLLDRSRGETEVQLFLARCDGRIAAGALVFRCGHSVHYLEGGSDRSFTRHHPSEAVHWAVIEWALNRGCRRYDLEGIDPKGNPGTYAFKKKMGGEDVTLVGRQLEPLNTTGRLLAPLATRLLSWEPAPLRSLARHLTARAVE